MIYVQTANVHLPPSEVPKVYRKYVEWVRLYCGVSPAVKPEDLDQVTIDHVYWSAVRAGYGTA